MEDTKAEKNKYIFSPTFVRKDLESRGRCNYFLYLCSNESFLKARDMKVIENKDYLVVRKERFDDVKTRKKPSRRVELD